jgi:hypothetical protein
MKIASRWQFLVNLLYELNVITQPQAGPWIWKKNDEMIFFFIQKTVKSVFITTSEQRTLAPVLKNQPESHTKLKWLQNFAPAFDQWPLFGSPKGGRWLYIQTCINNH